MTFFPDLLPLAIRLSRRCRYNPLSGCIEWTSGIGSSRYGVFGAIGSIWHGYYSPSAHRVALALATGECPATKEAAHSCHNRKCVTPAHLHWATKSENRHESAAIGRVSAGRGKGQRFTAKEVQKIRERLKNGERQSEIAKSLHVNRGVIFSIAKGRTWKWLNSNE